MKHNGSKVPYVKYPPPPLAPQNGTIRVQSPPHSASKQASLGTVFFSLHAIKEA
jgi:hypothetical protein